MQQFYEHESDICGARSWYIYIYFYTFMYTNFYIYTFIVAYECMYLNAYELWFWKSADSGKQLLPWDIYMKFLE